MMRLRDMRPSFMRDHMWARRHLAAYLDGALDTRGRHRLEHHAHLCPKCHQLVTTLVQTLEGLRALREPPLGMTSPISDSVIARLREESG